MWSASEIIQGWYSKRQVSFAASGFGEIVANRNRCERLRSRSKLKLGRECYRFERTLNSAIATRARFRMYRITGLKRYRFSDCGDFTEFQGYEADITLAEDD